MTVDPFAKTRRNQMQTRYQGKTLCAWCRKLDLDTVLAARHPTRLGKKIHKWTLTKGLNPTSCHLCQLFAHTYGENYSDYRHGLRSLSSSRINARGWASIDTAMLSLSGQPAWSPFLVPQRKGAETIRILEPWVSTVLLNEWMAYCCRWHTRVCGKVEDPPPLSQVPSFRLLDCHTGSVIPWSGQPFTTLSYVWGEGATAPLFSEKLCIRELPKTIRDAITVTLGLGLEHIWVDRYCINQQSQEDVNNQISKMDKIYQSSEVTIIDAASDDADGGLAGIGYPRAPWQHKAKVGKHLLVSSMRSPEIDIRLSKWWTRGWTYQEGVLARRRIIFSREQVYFECGGMYCSEALKLNLRALHTRDGQRFQARYQRSKANLGLFSARLGRSSWEVLDRIKEYSERELGKSSDVLNGFRGIFGVLENAPGRLRNLFGVPVLPRPPKLPEKHRQKRGPEAYKSPTWPPSAGFIAGLCWQTYLLPDRRSGFPTWSWTGWKIETRHGWAAPVEWALHTDARQRSLRISDISDGRTFQADEDIRVGIRLQDGRLLTWFEFAEHYDDLISRALPTLQLSAWVTPIYVRSWEQARRNTYSYATDVKRADRRDAYYCVTDVEAPDGWLLQWKFRPTTVYPFIPSNPSTELSPYLGVHLGRDLSFNHTYVLVVARVRPGLYERVGFGNWSIHNLHDSRETFLDFLNKDSVFGTTPHAPVRKVWQDLELQ